MNKWCIDANIEIINIMIMNTIGDYVNIYVMIIIACMNKILNKIRFFMFFDEYLWQFSVPGAQD